jgi:hypothetical protein
MPFPHGQLKQAQFPFIRQKAASDALHSHMQVTIARPRGKAFIATLCCDEVGFRDLVARNSIKCCKKTP